VPHDWDSVAVMECVPPPGQLRLASYDIDAEYRRELYSMYSFFTVEEIVGTFLGRNPGFPSQEAWLRGGYSSDDGEYSSEETE